MPGPMSIRLSFVPPHHVRMIPTFKRNFHPRIEKHYKVVVTMSVSLQIIKCRSNGQEEQVSSTLPLQDSSSWDNVELVFGITCRTSSRLDWMATFDSRLSQPTDMPTMEHRKATNDLCLSFNSDRTISIFLPLMTTMTMV
jgi:hypothetical protein